MIIDLSSPIVIGVLIAVISAIFIGTYHYFATLIRLKVTDKKFSDVLSELDTLHKNYKNEISELNKRHGNELAQALEQARATYDNKMDKILEHNKLSFSKDFDAAFARLKKLSEPK